MAGIEGMLMGPRNPLLARHETMVDTIAFVGNVDLRLLNPL